MSEDGFLEAAMGMRAKLYHVAMAILWDEQDAADAVQEAMLKGWKRRYTLRDEALFEAWFMRILVNQCRDLQRRQIRTRQLAERAAQSARLDGQGPARSTELFDAVRALPDGLRLPVLLYYFDGYSQKEIGRILGATRNQVNTRVRQGRERLRELLAEDSDDAWAKGGGGHE